MCRFWVSALVLAIVYRKNLFVGLKLCHIKLGILLGTIFLAAFYMQMLGLQYSTPSNNAIITSANVVLVPFVWWAVSKIRPKPITFLSCFISLIGVAILSVDFSSGFIIRAGDMFSLCAAIMFAAQIVAVGKLAKRVKYTTLVFMEFLTASIFATILFILTENKWQAFQKHTFLIPILYLGIVCTCICFFLQAWALRRVEPSRGAVIMSTEALFGSLLSILVGMDVVNWRILAGGGVLLFAILLPEFIKSAVKSDSNANAQNSFDQ